MTSRKTLILAVVTDILDTTITYPSCVHCYSKLLVDPTTNRYHCVKCGSNCDKHKVVWRYRLVISVSDQTCTGRVVVFGRCLDGFFGKTATDFTKSLDDLEQTGYPARSMLSEALLRTFLGKYFYFGFKIAGSCDTDGVAALKDVLNLDTSLVPSQLDCTSNFDTHHTLAHQMLSCSDAVFASVTDHMRILVKQLRTGSTSVVNKTQVNPHDKRNQSNNEISLQNRSSSISEALSFELGLDSVHFSFESNSNLICSVKKLDKNNGMKTEGRIKQALDTSEYQENDTKGFQQKETESSHTTNPLDNFSYVTVDTHYDDPNDVSNFNTDNYSYVDIHNHTDISQHPCETLSNIPVTQKLLFDSPNIQTQSNTSRKIDKELFRREIIHSLSTFPISQISSLSRTTNFCQDTVNATKNCMNSMLGSNRAMVDDNNTFRNMCGMGFLHNGAGTDFKPRTSQSLLRNDLAAEFAMPESEDLNAFFDSEFDGFVFSQDKEDSSETLNCSAEEVTDKIGHKGNEASEHVVGNPDNHGQPIDQVVGTIGQDINTTEDCSTDKCNVLTSKTENTSKGCIESYEHSSGIDSQLIDDKNCSLKNEIEGISKSFCKNVDIHASPATETFSDSFEECFIENELNCEQKSHVSDSLSPMHAIDSHDCKHSPVAKTTAAIDDESKAGGVSEDLEHFFADISKYEIDKHKTENELNNKPYSDNQKENDSLDNDLEQFFSDISKYEIDNHHSRRNEKANVDDHNKDEKLLSEDVVMHLFDSCEVDWQDNEFMNSIANDMDENVDSLWVANTPEYMEPTPEVKDHVRSVDSMFQCNGQRMKSDSSKERFSGDEGSSSCHFDFLTSCSSITEGSDGLYKQAKITEKSPLLETDLFNSSDKDSRKIIKLQVPKNSSKINDCDNLPYVMKTENKAESSVSILAVNSFDASDDLFEVTDGLLSDDDCLDRCVIMDTLVEDSLCDESPLKTGPLKASTPGSDHAVIVDSLEYVVVESDSEIDIDEHSEFDGKKVVKFDHKLRRVSRCNFMDLKMKVNNSPLISLDQNILLKSCLKQPRNLILQKNEERSVKVQYSKLDKSSAKVIEDTSEVLTSVTDSPHSNSDNASIDLFADSFDSPEYADGAVRHLELEDCNTNNFPVNNPEKVDSFSEHWSGDVSDNFLLEADTCDQDNKENNSEMNKMEFDIVKTLPKGVKCSRLSTSKKVEKHVELTDSWSYSCGSKPVKEIGCMKSKDCKTDQIRFAEPEKRIREKLNDQHCVLKCLVLNTSDCDRISHSYIARKNKKTPNQSNEDHSAHMKQFYSPDLFGDSILEIDTKDDNLTDCDKMKTHDSNNTQKQKESYDIDKQDFNAQQSLFYSPDLFGDSILDLDDIDDIVCDKVNDVLCKKLFF